ncbi:ABC transporter permease [Algoriphagus formosus]|uniref:ABC transporter permease n=1 Tax=Algoriphagus formosus TaxID=2007308 RepID=UPI003F7035A3
MWKNDLKIAWRNLLKNRVDSMINLGGLTIGFFAVFLIALYVNFSKSFDKDLPQTEQLYRVNLNSRVSGKEMDKSARTAPAMGMVFKEDLAEVEDFSRVIIMGEVIAGQDDSFVREDQIFITDEAYFEFFNINLTQGSEEGIGQPLQVYLSENISNRIFGGKDPVGQTLDINSTNFDGTVEFQVAGVYQDLPTNRHLRPELMISYATLHHFLGSEIDNSYDWLNQYTYLKLSPGVNIEETTNKLNASLQTHHGDQLNASGTEWDVDLIAVGDIHNSLAYSGEYNQGVDGRKLTYFVWIGFFVLVMVYLNSMNIATSKAQNRSKEIGVRKVSGSSRMQLIRLFLMESYLSHFIAILIACFLIFGFGDWVNQILGLGLPIDSLQLSHYLGWILSFWVLGSFISGIYPALLLTSFSAHKAIKGESKLSFRQAFGSPLLVVQLVFCLVILAGIMTTYKQIDFMRSRDLGLELDNRIVVRSPMLFVDGSGNYQEKMKATIGALPQVQSIAAANEIPGNEIYWKTEDFHLEGKEKSGVMYSMLSVGEEYFKLFNLKILAGRQFNPIGEGEEAIINQNALAGLGLDNPEDALGKSLISGRGEARIVGVVEDYYQEAVNSPLDPMVLNYSPGDLNYYILKVNSLEEMGNLLQKIESSFQANFPQSPFEYFFLDEFFDKQYKAELQFQKLFALASLVAIFIAVMGIFGVTSQVLLSRLKEVSIRKILGASSSSILMMISKDYFYWLGACFLLGVPLAYFLFTEWLQEFPVRIEMGWWFYTLPVLSILLIFFSTALVLTIRTVFVNPAKILKSE